MERTHTRTFKILWVLRQVNMGAFLFFFVYGFLLWGLTQDFKFTDRLINTSDVGFYLWCFKWWGFAIINGTNPFYTDLLFAPYGLNLSWTTCVPLFSVFTIPADNIKDYTFLYNGLVSLNLSLSGFLFYLILREFDIQKKLSVFVSALFVLSPYIWAKNHGHLNLLFVVFVLCMIYVVILKIKDKISDKSYTLIMAVFIVCQFLVSVEVMFSTVWIGFFIAIISMIIYKDKISYILRLSTLTVIAGILSITALSPYLYAMLSDMPEYNFNDNKTYGVDLISLILPSADRLLHTQETHDLILKTTIGGNTSEQTGYLGIPILVVIFLYGIKVIKSREKNGVFLVVIFTLVTLLGLGAVTRFEGVDIAPGLFKLFANLPFFEHMLPNRLFLFVDIAACIILAHYLKCLTSKKGLAVFSLVVISWLPDITQYKGENIDILLPKNSAIQTLKHYINRGDNVIVFPSYNMNSPEPALIQVASDFWFRLSQIVAGLYPSNIVRYTGFLTDPKYDDFQTISDFLKYIQLCDVKWVIIHRQKGLLREKTQQLESWFGIFFNKIEISDDLVIYKVDQNTEGFKKLKQAAAQMAVNLITDYKLKVEKYIKDGGSRDVVNAKRLIETGYIKDKTPNPSDPNFTTDYYWIGELECDGGKRCFGIGLNINFDQEAQYIYDSFKNKATAILIPFPNPYTRDSIKTDDKIFCVVVFRHGE